MCCPAAERPGPGRPGPDHPDPGPDHPERAARAAGRPDGAGRRSPRRTGCCPPAACAGRDADRSASAGSRRCRNHRRRPPPPPDAAGPAPAGPGTAGPGPVVPGTGPPGTVPRATGGPEPGEREAGGREAARSGTDPDDREAEPRAEDRMGGPERPGSPEPLPQPPRAARWTGRRAATASPVRDADPDGDRSDAGRELRRPAAGGTGPPPNWADRARHRRDRTATVHRAGPGRRDGAGRRGAPGRRQHSSTPATYARRVPPRSRTGTSRTRRDPATCSGPACY